MIPVVSILLALGLPVFALYRQGKGKTVRRPYLYSCASFVACACGILTEILTIKRRLFAGDIGGIEDTIAAVIVICIMLIVVTSVVNLILMGISYEKT